ncbi:adenosine deaminase [Candidatus Microgenomates bacterium]|nr:adenosine deaminase [Candidatus Microgenomates bacterium]
MLNHLSLTELHVHVGSSVDPAIMWEIAHEQGIRLPTKDFCKFKKLITIEKKTTYKKYLKLFGLTELIQSSPYAIERSVYSIASGAYRTNNITKLEIRFNPMKRNRNGERDLDHIILASIRGMEKATLQYPIRVGLIFCLDRAFPLKLNKTIAEKAIKYKKCGVVGVDLAGPDLGKPPHPTTNIQSLKRIIDLCHNERLGITIHTGETTNSQEMWEVIKFLSPDRIGHGIKAVYDKKLLKELKKRKIVLEICPTSNLHTRVIKNLKELKFVFETLKKEKILFTINTDGPVMLKTNLKKEFGFLLRNKILSKEDLLWANKIAKKASFLR